MKTKLIAMCSCATIALFLIPIGGVTLREAEAQSGPILRMYNHKDFNEGETASAWEVRLSTSWLNLTSVEEKNGDLFDFNDKMTSYIVAQGYTVVFYKHINYGEELFRVPPKPLRNREVGTPGNSPSDDVSSVRILGPDGVEIPAP